MSTVNAFQLNAFEADGFQEAVSGAAAVTIGKPTISGTSTETVAGTGAVAISHPTLAGNGTEGISGTGTVTFLRPTLDGTGEATDEIEVMEPIRQGGAWLDWTYQRPPMPQIRITGSGGVTFSQPTLSGRGDVNDDDLVMGLDETSLLGIAA